MSEASAFIREIIGAIAGDLLFLLVIVLVLVMVGSLLYALLHWAGFEVSFSGRGEPDDVESQGDAERPTTLERFRRGPLSITVESAEPKVFSMDRTTLDRAREMVRTGADLDTVCRHVLPVYADWPEFQRRAFRATFRAALAAEEPAEGPE